MCFFAVCQIAAKSAAAIILKIHSKKMLRNVRRGVISLRSIGMPKPRGARRQLRSNGGMTHPESGAGQFPYSTDLVDRLEALELKACDMDDTVEQLNLAVYRQQQEIDRLAALVALLRSQRTEQDAHASQGAAHEPPPHY